MLETTAEPRTYRYLQPLLLFGIFNHFYYEDVLVVRVHKELLTKQKLALASHQVIWEDRYEDFRCVELIWRETASSSASSLCGRRRPSGRDAYAEIPPVPAIERNHCCRFGGGGRVFRRRRHVLARREAKL